jgi:hypothetical protein
VACLIAQICLRSARKVATRTDGKRVERTTAIGLVKEIGPATAGASRWEHKMIAEVEQPVKSCNINELKIDGDVSEGENGPSGMPFPDDRETAYHCTATWHLARMSKAAGLIYSLACVISKISHQFFCSAPNLAQYLDYERRQIYRALRELETARFLELISSRNFQTNVYRVVLHAEWAEKHPGKCATKQTFVWEAEGDELGRQMYALSGGRYRFREHEVKILRKTGLTEKDILAEWQDFIDRWEPLNPQDEKYPFSRFHDVVKVKMGNSNRLQTLIVQLYQMSGYVFSGAYKADLTSMIQNSPDTEIIDRFNNHLTNQLEVKDAVRKFCEEIRREQIARILHGRNGKTEPRKVPIETVLV